MRKGRSCRAVSEPSERKLTTRIGRREFMGAVAAAAVAGCVSTSRTSSDSGRRPNVIIILLDDLGYADLGCQGISRDVETPNIDSLARSGVRFASAYSTAPVGSPARAALLTGRYQQRFGHEHNPGNLAGQVKLGIGLPPSEFTLGRILKDHGYATGIIGKWHLGAGEKQHPLTRGFEEFFGFLGGTHSYTTWDDITWGPIYRGMAAALGEEYLTDAFSREAVSFVKRHRRGPFFLYLAYNALRVPLEAPPEYLSRFPHIREESRRTLLAMLSAADDGIGRLLAALRESDLDGDTLIFVLSDNGGDPDGNASSNTPLRGGRGTLYEGGIRVPFILRRPGGPTGIVYDEPISTLDVLPTVLSATGSGPPRGRVFDGVNLLPYLTEGRGRKPHDTLYWRLGENFAVRIGEWKLVRSGRPVAALYKLSEDPGETRDLSEAQPKIVKALAADYARWQAQMIEPLWTLAPPGAEPPRRNTR